MDQVTLCSLERGTSTIRTLTGGQKIVFGFLLPGPYGLTLTRGSRAMSVVISLPPGGNLFLRCRIQQGCCNWQRDWFHYFFNTP